LAWWIIIYYCLFGENYMNLAWLGELGFMLGLGMKWSDFGSLIGVRFCEIDLDLNKQELYVFDLMKKECQNA